MNVSAGDLAVIVKTGLPECEANIGAIVSVVEWMGDDWGWLIESRGRLLDCFTFDGPDKRQRICAHDLSLRPILPDPERESTPQHEPTTEHV